MVEADMLYDERDPRIARQELFEAFIGSFGGPACAPMPGTLIEMLEIAAMERQQQSGIIPPEAVSETTAPLTSPQIGSRMLTWLRKAGEAIVDVAGRFRPRSDARRLPVRPVARPFAAQ
jgi:hypothetical protein